MPLAPSQRTATTGELFVCSDPDAVGAWCREHLTPDCVFIAPSADARRRVLQRVAAARGVTLGLTAVSPGRFIALLEARAGLAPPKLIPGPLERLLAIRAARDAAIPLFTNGAQDPPAGAVRAVTELFRALRGNRITAEQYADAGGDARAAKAYTLYETARIALGFEDAAGRISRLLDHGVPSVSLIIQEPQFANRLAFDLYAAALSASSSCHVGVSDLGVDDGDPPSVTLLGTLGMRVTRGAASSVSPRMRAIGGVGMVDETELAARHILALIRPEASANGDRGAGSSAVHPSDVLAVVPSTAYLTLVSDACARIGVPIASPRRIPAADAPLVRSVLETFHLLANERDDTPERGLALLGTPYLGLSLREHDHLARALVTRGLGALRSWQQLSTDVRRPRFQRFAEDVAFMAHHVTGERQPRELARVLTSIGLTHGFLSAGRRAHLAAGRDEALRIDQQGWEALTDAVNELNDCLRELGITMVSARWWLAELTVALADATVRVDAKAVNGVHVTVAGPGLPRARHVFALGWREGLVPRRLRDQPLLPDVVKRTLNDTGAMFALGPDRAARDAERRERVRRAATESLTISWPAVDEEGEALLPSFYLDDLGVTERVTRGVGDTTWITPLAAGRNERVARAIFAAHHRPAATLGDELPLVRHALANLASGEQRAYRGELHAPQAIALPTEMIAELAPLASSMSASQASAITHCLYEHFARKRLGVASLQAPAVDRLMLGNIAHAVLTEIGGCGFAPDQFEDIFARHWESTVPEHLATNPATLFDRSILESDLRTMVTAEHAALQTRDAKPAHFELAFGLPARDNDRASRPDGMPITLPPGASLTRSTLRGSIDRVDVIERDGMKYGVAVDYKLGKGESYLKDMEDFADFQLPIYCGALPMFGIEPVGAYFFGLASGERYGMVRDDFADAFVPADARKIRRVSADEFSSFMIERQKVLAGEIARLSLGALVAKPRLDDCRFCDLRPLCRIGTFGVGQASGHE